MNPAKKMIDYFLNELRAGFAPGTRPIGKLNIDGRVLLAKIRLQQRINRANGVTVALCQAEARRKARYANR